MLLKTTSWFWLAMVFVLVSCEYKVITMPEGQIPDEVNFSVHVQPIFDANCISCHASQAFPPILLENVAYNNLFTGGYIDTVQADQSGLYIKIQSSHPDQFVPTLQEKELILKWIEEGAKNN